VPIVIDVSTGTVAFGKLRMAANQGEEVPEGWLIDGDGRSTTDPNTFFAQPQQSALLPLGGLQTGYKGFALGLLVDVLAGALGGAGCSTGSEIGREGNGIFLLVVDPSHFGTTEAFNSAVAGLVSGIKNCRRAPDVDEITIPGERAARERDSRERNGIPIDEPTRLRLRQILSELELKQEFQTL
jgi:LDH2 family malate/lactate/ureidoglycolate dehydrogenase